MLLLAPNRVKRNSSGDKVLWSTAEIGITVLGGGLLGKLSYGGVYQPGADPLKNSRGFRRRNGILVLEGALGERFGVLCRGYVVQGVCCDELLWKTI